MNPNYSSTNTNASGLKYTKSLGLPQSLLRDWAEAPLQAQERYPAAQPTHRCSPDLANSFPPSRKCCQSSAGDFFFLMKI